MFVLGTLLPSNVVEHINDNVENMLNDIHQQSSQPGSTMQASTGTKVDALSMARSTKLVKFKTIPQKDANVQGIQ